MALLKNHYTVVIFLLFCIPFISGCRKDKRNPIRFKVNAHVPYSGEPIPNVKWVIREVKRVYQGGYSTENRATGWKIEGETDINGRSTVEFYPKKNTKYSYFVKFDYSEMDIPFGDYKLTKGNPSGSLNRNASLGNDFEVRVLPRLLVQKNFLNTNCFNASDIFRYKMLNIDERPQDNIEHQSWKELSIFSGCVDYSNESIQLGGRYVYHWEALRNEITETGTDTFFVAPGVNSVISMHW